MSKIKSVKAYEILDSRGNPTIETTIVLDNDLEAVSSVPSGASTSSFEAYELRDGDSSRYEGKGVLKACEIVNGTLSKMLVSKDPTDQALIDKEMTALDGTNNKSRLGGNSIISVSQTLTKAGAASQRLKLWEYIQYLSNNLGIPKLRATNPEGLPTPTFNLINGGKHGAGNLDIQEFHVAPGTDIPYHKALEMGQKIYESLKEILLKRQLISSTGDEGGFALNLPNNQEALELILEAVGASSLKAYSDVFLGLDLAATSFYSNGKYLIKDKEKPLNSPEMIDYLKSLVEKYHLLFVEDPLYEDAWPDWQSLTEQIGANTMVIGDDLLATNINRVKKAISEKAVNAVLVKPNQAGTVTETLEVVKLARENGLKTIVSHRSGDTNDSFIADLAVGVGSEYVKFGAPARGERIAKYNRLLEIERELEISD